MKVVFGIAVAIIIFLVVLLGIKAFYPEPKLDSFNCSYEYRVPLPVPYAIEKCPSNITVEECKNLQEKNSENIEDAKSIEEQKDCYEDYEKAKKDYRRNLFFILNVIGILSIIISMSLFSMPNLSSGIAFSGIALIVYGFGNGWESTDNMLKFFVAIIIAAIIIIFAVRVNKKK